MRSLALLSLLAFCLPSLLAKPLVYEGTKGLGKGKHLVFIASDHEYRSEETLPALARILAKHHGFKCTVCFGVDENGELKAGHSNIPGLEALKSADLMVIFTRFQNLPDDQMVHIVDYLDRGGPVVGLRTSSHAFKIPANAKYASYDFRSKVSGYENGFGHQVLGNTWVGHYGRNHKQGTRIKLVPGQKDHPILKGVADNAFTHAGAYTGIAADDFTVRGGAADAAIIGKQIAAEKMAGELRLPIIRLIDGTGGGGSVRTLDTDPSKKVSEGDGGHGRGARTYVPMNPAWEHVVANLATVPTVALCLGSVAGLGAARAVTSHYSVMVKGMSHLFAAGPVVVNRMGGEQVDKEDLGGSRIHTRNGAIDDEVRSEEEAFERTRRFLSYLPSSVHELAQRGPCTDDPGRTDPGLGDVVPRDRRQVYKMRSIIESVVDGGKIGRAHV